MNTIAMAAVLLTASAAAAQDTLRVREKDGRIGEKSGEVLTLTYKVVQYEQNLGDSKAKLQEDAPNIVEIVADQNGRTFEYNQGEQAFNNGQWDQAIERFEKVRRDPRARELLKQLAAISVVRAQWNKDNAQGTIAAAKQLRTEKPEGFFVRESFELEIQANLAAGNVNGANAAITAFEEKGKSDNMSEWVKAADVKRARVLELGGKHREALAIYRKYARDREAGEDATLGELRCLSAIPDLNTLGTRSEALINEAKGKKEGFSTRVLMGAYNGRGEAALNAGKVKEALLDFLQGALVLNKGGEPNLEHEASLGGGAIAAAKMAAAQKDKGPKDIYRQRAMELLGELEQVYPRSRFKAKAQEALQAAK